MILTNPGWSVHDEAATADPSAPLRPVYPATEGIPPRFLHDRIRSLINEVVPAMVDPLPDTTRQRWNLLSLQDALRQLHQPNDESEIEAARQRLAFEELLGLQLVVARRRYGIRTAKPATELTTNDALDTELQDLLPFALTGAQPRAIGDIRQDLERPVPMHRLLQGDVGAGKTAVRAGRPVAMFASRSAGRIHGPHRTAGRATPPNPDRPLGDRFIRTSVHGILLGSGASNRRRRRGGRARRPLCGHPAAAAVLNIWVCKMQVWWWWTSSTALACVNARSAPSRSANSPTSWL